MALEAAAAPVASLSPSAAVGDSEAAVAPRMPEQWKRDMFRTRNVSRNLKMLHDDVAMMLLMQPSKHKRRL